MRRTLPLVAAAVVLALVLGYALGVSAQERPVRIFVNGKEIPCNPPAFIKDGRTFVPIRFVSEALGLRVDWHAETHSVRITSLSPDPAIPDWRDFYEERAYTIGKKISEVLASVKLSDKEAASLLNATAEMVGAKIYEIASTSPPPRAYDVAHCLYIQALCLTQELLIAGSDFSRATSEGNLAQAHSLFTAVNYLADRALSFWDRLSEVLKEAPTVPKR